MRLLAALSVLLLAGCNRGSIDSPVPLPIEASGLLKAKMVLSPLAGVQAEIQIYNGSDWKVTALDAAVTNKKSGETRVFRFNCNQLEVTKRNESTGAPIETVERHSSIPVLSAGAVDADLGDFLDDVKTDNNFAWTVQAAYGFK
jgi:hypothetical protein